MLGRRGRTLIVASKEFECGKGPKWIDNTTAILNVGMDLSEVLKGDPIVGVDLEEILSIR